MAYEHTTSLHNYRPQENLARLRVALVGDARIAVEDLLRTCCDPEEIIKALEDAFGHPNLLLQSAIQKVRALPKVTDSGRELLTFTTVVRNCVSVLKTVRADGYLNNPQLVNELLAKLTPYHRAQYGEYAMRLNKTSGVDLRVSPSLTVLLDFLNNLSQASAYYAMDSNFPSIAAIAPAAAGRRDKGVAALRAAHRLHVQQEVGSKTVSEVLNNSNGCVMCNNGHKLSECEQFKNLDLNERWDFIKKLKLCFKCLNNAHSRKYCRAKRCSKCRWPHHDLLHSDRPRAVTPQPTPGRAGESTPSAAELAPESLPRPFDVLTNIGECRARALLKVIPVTVISSCGVKRPTYALLDDGASVSLIDEKFASGCDGPIVPIRLMTARGHCVVDNSSRMVKIVVCGLNGTCHTICVRTISNLNLPSQTIPAHVLADKHLRDLSCREMGEAKPMLLLGQDNWELIVGGELRRGKSGRPVASLTKLGWVIHGPLTTRSVAHSANCLSVSPDLHELVKLQFELEAIGISKIPRKNSEIEYALKVLKSTSRRVSGGWEVGLLWKRDRVEMPDDYEYARRRLLSIERKMDRDPIFADAYCNQVDRLLSEGFARKLTCGINASPVWYLPHFGVTNVHKPGKLRLVFDAAATCQGTSLNDNLLSGPDLMNSLLGVLIRFRLGKIAFTADIADMFLRIKIREADQGAQLFLWRGRDRACDPSIYAMNSMIFGAKSSPTSAIYILNKNADEFAETHAQAVQAIKRKHYVDDYLDSVDCVDAAQQLITDVTHIHRAGGFEIRGWVTNSPELNTILSFVAPGRVKLDKSEDERILGMIWCAASDCLKFDLSFKRLPAELVEGRVKPTKREFLRFIMSIFDPLGLVYPCVIQSRVLMQRIWQSGIGWDDFIQDSEADKWFQWVSNLKIISHVSVPRWYGLQLAGAELHVFGDASEKAYAVVAYIVGKNANGERACAMVAGKARVAPLKIVSIPRLELQAAVLASRLAVTVKTELDAADLQVYFWTDSRTVLLWIQSDAREYPKFISHRLAEIDTLSKRCDWRWVPSSLNPADEATRLDWPNDRGMWLSGPSFLCDPQVSWPTIGEVTTCADDLERIERVLVAVDPPPSVVDVTRFSSWTRALRVTARVLCFISACRGQEVSLTASRLREAERLLLMEAQTRSFHLELSVLRCGKPLPKTSRLLRLDPMLYEDGLLRVRGRLSASSDLSFDEKHPVIMDGDNPTTRLLIHYYHLRALHANNETVVNSVRERFWVTRIRPAVKAVVSRCQYCRVQRAQPSPPKMGDLPAVRLESTRRAFVNCGVDYFGPMEVTIGRRRQKRWGVLFTCLATRAVHLELAASLSSDSALLALRRLTARRGRPAVVLSDCGTNFIGASRELRVALKEFDKKKLQGEALATGIEWRFNPPAAPHMGGCWERLIRSVKSALRTVLKERAPPEEVLHTLLLEVELVVNSRPLAYVSTDHDEPVVLTPNHLLIGTAAGDPPSAPYSPTDIDARRQWRRVNALADMLWRRWTKEYLSGLQR